MLITIGKSTSNPIVVYKNGSSAWNDGDFYDAAILYLDRIFGDRKNYTVISQSTKWTPFGSNVSYYIIGIMDKDGVGHKLFFTVSDKREYSRPVAGANNDAVVQKTEVVEEAKPEEDVVNGGVSIDDLTMDSSVIADVCEKTMISDDLQKIETEVEKDESGLTGTEQDDKVVAEKPKKRGRITRKKKKIDA